MDFGTYVFESWIAKVEVTRLLKSDWWKTTDSQPFSLSGVWLAPVMLLFMLLDAGVEKTSTS